MSDSLSDAPSGSPSEERLTGRRLTGRFTAFARKWLAPVRSCRPLLGCALVGLLGGTAYGVLAPPQYAATTYVVAVPAKGSDPATALGFAQAFGRISTSNATLVRAQDAAGVPARSLGGHVRAETSPESAMIGITGTATTAGTSARIANAVADAITVSGNEAARNTGVRLVLFSQAVAPSSQMSPSLPISIAVGGCAGGLLGALLLLVGPKRERWTPAGTPVPAPAGSAESAGSGSAGSAEPAEEPTVKVSAKVKAQAKVKERV